MGNVCLGMNFCLQKIMVYRLYLGGGFKYFLFSLLFGEMILFE